MRNACSTLRLEDEMLGMVTVSDLAQEIEMARMLHGPHPEAFAMLTHTLGQLTDALPIDASIDTYPLDPEIVHDVRSMIGQLFAGALYN